MQWYHHLGIILSIPLFYFFFLVVSADLVDGNLKFRYKARLPEIVRTAICMVPAINLFSPYRAAGEDPFVLYLALGLLSAPFAVGLKTAPTGKDALKVSTFIPKWFVSKLEAIVYGAIALVFTSVTLSVFDFPNDLPGRLVLEIVPNLILSDNTPTTPVFLVVLAGAACRAFVVTRAMKGTQAPVMVGFLLIGSTFGALILWLLALSQVDFTLSSWTAPVGGLTGLVIALWSDLVFKRDVYITSQRHGMW